MENAEVEGLYRKAHRELQDLERQRYELDHQAAALTKIVSGLEELFPFLTAHNERQIPLAASGVLGAINAVFAQHPGEWLTVKQIVAAMRPDFVAGLKDPEAAARAVLRRAESFESKKLDGRTLAYRRLTS